MTTRADRIVEQAEDWLGRSEKSPVHGRSWSVAHDVARELIGVVKGSPRVSVKWVDPETGEESLPDQRSPSVGVLVELRAAGAGWRWHDKDGQEWDTAAGANGPIWHPVPRAVWTTDQLIAAIRTAVESVLASQKEARQQVADVERERQERDEQTIKHAVRVLKELQHTYKYGSESRFDFTAGDMVMLDHLIRICRRKVSGAPPEDPKACVGELVDGGLLLCKECGPGNVSRCFRREGFTV